MNCPSCGAEIDADKRVALLTVCPYCRAAIVVDEKAAEVAGKMAVLAQSSGPLYTGGTGNLGGKNFTVVGRVRYGYEKGYWDEWYLEFEHGKFGWIGEDEGNFTISHMSDRNVPSSLYAKAEPGSHLEFGDRSWHVDEKDVAECEGGEGQLPFKVVTGEKYPFIDMSSGKDQFATIEFDLGEQHARVYRGKRLSAAAIKMDMEKPSEAWGQPVGLDMAESVEREAGEGKRERIVISGKRTKALNCFACGGTLDVPGEPVESITCPYCSATNNIEGEEITCPGCDTGFPSPGAEKTKSAICPHCNAQVDLRRSLPKMLGHRVTKAKPKLAIKVGQSCKLRGKSYVVMGHIRYRTRDDSGYYIDDEFLLFNNEAGYIWLLLTEGNFTLAHEVDERPPSKPPVMKRASYNFLGHHWKVVESSISEGGTTKITWVDGQLPYVAQVGDNSAYIDMIAPPYLLSVETTATEQEFFFGEYIPRKEIAEAFSMEVSDLPPKTNVGANEPYSIHPMRRQWFWVALIFFVINLLLTIVAFMVTGSQVAQLQVATGQYSQEYLTEPFTLPEGGLYQADFHSPVDNGWVYLDIALVDAENNVVQDFSSEISYYHGYDDGYWSEGGQDDSAVFRVPDAGDYRLLMKGEGEGQRDVSITLREGPVLARYFLLLTILLGLWVAVELLLKGYFEKRRWGVEFESDD